MTVDQAKALYHIGKREFMWGLFTLRTVVIGVLFLLAVGVASYGIISLGAVGGGQQEEAAGTAISLLFFSFAILFFGPIIGIAAGYDTVSSERTSGSIALVLSKPVQKPVLLAGKFAGRAGAVAVPIVVGLGIGFAATSFTFDFDPGLMVGHIALTLLMVVSFQALAMFISTLVKSDRSAILSAIAVWILTVPLWDLVRFLLVEQANLPEAAVDVLNAARVYLASVLELIAGQLQAEVPPQFLPSFSVETGLPVWSILVMHVVAFAVLAAVVFQFQDEA